MGRPEGRPLSAVSPDKETDRDPDQETEAKESQETRTRKARKARKDGEGSQGRTGKAQSYFRRGIKHNLRLGLIVCQVVEALERLMYR